jgi:hypothetical protein
MKSRPSNEQQATIEALLDASKRKSRRVNIRNTFVQLGTQDHPVPGQLAAMVKAHDERALDLYLLHRALVSKEPWTSRPLLSEVWARALSVDTDADGGIAVVSKAWSRLDKKYKLIDRSKSGRIAVFTALREDGTRDPYTSPDGKTQAERFFTLPFEYWLAEQAWYRSLPMHAKAVLLIGSTLKADFILPTERAKDWYGISTETAQRGLQHLQEVKLLHRRTVVKPNPLAKNMITQEYHYTLHPPFGRVGKTTRPALTLVTEVGA